MKRWHPPPPPDPDRREGPQKKTRVQGNIRDDSLAGMRERNAVWKHRFRHSAGVNATRACRDRFILLRMLEMLEANGVRDEVLVGLVDEALKAARQEAAEEVRAKRDRYQVLA